MRTKCYVLSLVGIMLLFALSLDAGEMRTWTRKSGKTFEAEFVSFTKGEGVTVKGKDGKEFTIKMGGLSEEDRKYVNQQAKGKGKAVPKQGDNQKPANATWRMAGEYPSLAGKWAENEEGKRYVTITQDGNKFAGKSNVFRLGDDADRQYRFEGTVNKSGRVSGTIVSSKNGHDEKPGTIRGKLAADGKTVRIHSKEEGGESDWTLTWKGGEEPKQAGTKKHRKKSHADDSSVAKKDKPGHQPEETSSDQPKTMIVEAKGSGRDRDEALKDAFRDAVRKVVGAYVEEESAERNDKIIKDQVLTYSGGCVKDHGIVSDYKDGSITVWALVEQDKVVKRLKAASVSVKEVAGGKMWDEMQSKRWKDEEAADLLRSVLKDFPANCVKAEVVGEPKPIVRSQLDPRSPLLTPEQRQAVRAGGSPALTDYQKASLRPNENPQGVVIQVNVKFSIDEQAFDAFRERLMAAISHIALRGNDFLVKYFGNNARPFSSENIHGVIIQQGLTLFVNTSRNELWTTLGWRAYILDANLEPVLAGAANQSCECILSSQDASGQSKPIDAFRPKEVATFFAKHSNGPTMISFAIAGTFVQHNGMALLVAHYPKLVYQREIRLAENEVKDLKKIKCELRWSGSDPRSR